MYKYYSLLFLIVANITIAMDKQITKESTSDISVLKSNLYVKNYYYVTNKDIILHAITTAQETFYTIDQNAIWELLKILKKNNLKFNKLNDNTIIREQSQHITFSTIDPITSFHIKPNVPPFDLNKLNKKYGIRNPSIDSRLNKTRQ